MGKMGRSLKARFSDESRTAVDNPMSSDMVCVSSDDDLPVLSVTTAFSSSASRADVLSLYMGEAKSLDGSSCFVVCSKGIFNCSQADADRIHHRRRGRALVWQRNVDESRDAAWT